MSMINFPNLYKFLNLGEDNKEAIEQLEQEIGNLNTNAALKNKENTFTSLQTFNQGLTSNKPVNINESLSINGSAWLFFNKDKSGSTRLCSFEIDGNNFKINARAGNLKITSSSGNIDADSKRIMNVATPTSNNDVANKAYVDTKMQYLLDEFQSLRNTLLNN